MTKYQAKNPLEVATTIEGALVLLDRDGWCKGITADGTGARCVTGALYAASQGYRSDVLYDAVQCIRSHMIPTYCWGHIGLEAYNDDRRTRKRGIRRLLQRTLRTLRKQLTESFRA